MAVRGRVAPKLAHIAPFAGLLCFTYGHGHRLKIGAGCTRYGRLATPEANDDPTPDSRLNQDSQPLG